MSEMPRFVRAAAVAVGVMLFAAHSACAADGATPNDTARFLAGMPPPAESPLEPLSREPTWQQHAKHFDSAWSRLGSQQLSKVRAWSRENLTERRPVMFYMFSGPDFLYADAFFPNATTYVLSGLEPIGPIPDVTRLSRGSLPHALGHLRSSLNNVLNYSFFVTRDMSRKLHGGQLPGTLPILYVFLARSGKTIGDVSFVSIGKDGTLQPPGESGSTATTPGVKIVFSGGGGGTQTLYYFRTDLSDGGVRNSGFLKFCERLGTGDSFVKSASYLMHSDGFSKVRDFLLTRSASIVQDDSGIPVRFFDPADWKVHPFGRYVGPIGIFRNRHQTKLRELFSNGTPNRLDFGIGYRWRAHESNLLLALRRKSAMSVPGQ
jgi:hypothetical protein